MRWTRRTETAPVLHPAPDPLAGLGRKSLDSLRVGVVLLDPSDQVLMANPSARAMGLLRAGSES